MTQRDLMMTPTSLTKRVRRSTALAAHVVALGLFLGGCASVAPPEQLPRLAARHDLSLPAAADFQKATVPHRAWWEELQDPQLNQLLTEAQAGSLRIQGALAAVQEARAIAGIASRAGQPQGSLGLSRVTSRASQPEVDPYRLGFPRPPEQQLFQLTQVFGWELDLFGRVDTARAVAERELDASQADLRGSQALLQADVVNRYIELRATQQAIGVIDEQIALEDAARQRVADRVSAGLMDSRELNGVDARLVHLKAERGTLHHQVKQTLSAIAVLCGRTPADFGRMAPGLATPQPLPAVPQQSMLQLSDDWLGRLPHVARADAVLRASLGQEVLAQRAHLPRLSLGATLGLNESAARLGRASAVRYSAGPTLQWDWLDAGRIAAREAAANAGSERAWADFEQAVLQSLGDADSALRTWQAQYEEWQSAQQALSTMDRTFRYTRARQQLGLEPSVATLQSDAHRLQAQRTLHTRHARALQAYVNVQLALGTWQQPSAD